MFYLENKKAQNIYPSVLKPLVIKMRWFSYLQNNVDRDSDIIGLTYKVQCNTNLLDISNCIHEYTRVEYSEFFVSKS